MMAWNATHEEEMPCLAEAGQGYLEFVGSN